MTAPETIFAQPSPEEGWARIGQWNVEFGWDQEEVEYTRYDLTIRRDDPVLMQVVEALEASLRAEVGHGLKSRDALAALKERMGVEL